VTRDRKDVCRLRRDGKQFTEKELEQEYELSGKDSAVLVFLENLTKAREGKRKHDQLKRRVHSMSTVCHQLREMQREIDKDGPGFRCA